MKRDVCSHKDQSPCHSTDSSVRFDKYTLLLAVCESTSFRERQPAPEGLLKGVVPRGEFHEISKSVSQALLTGVAPTREIHLRNQPAPEALLTGVASKGEFHRTVLMSAGTALMRTETAREVARPPGLSLMVF